MDEIAVPQAILEKLRCSLCKDYLSCSPIKLTSNGGSICGRCLPSSDAASTYRNLILEEIISKLSFPCRFREYGCEECLPFGQTNEHEEKCIYRALPCPVLTSCRWTGLSLDLSDHFIKDHPDLTEENPEFKIEINQDKQGIFMTTVDEISFFIKYSYNFNEDELHYSVSYISEKVEEAAYKIRLTNNSDRDYSFTFKGGTCVPYEINFSALPNLKNVTLKQYLGHLGNPDCIMVTLLLNIKKHEGKEAVNYYKALEHLRCSNCRGYLVPPLYDCHKGIICADCSCKTPNSLLSTNEEVQQVVMSLSFPCRWQECTRVEPGSDIHKHEQNCKFRLRKCEFCTETINLKTADCHLRAHGCKRLYKEVVFTFPLIGPQLSGSGLLGTPPAVPQKNYFYVIKNNEINYIFVKREPRSQPQALDQFGLPRAFVAPICKLIISLTCKTVLKDMPSTTIYFEHPHCKVRSRIFAIDQPTTPIVIDLNELPACFTLSDPLKATLNTE